METLYFAIGVVCVAFALVIALSPKITILPKRIVCLSRTWYMFMMYGVFVLIYAGLCVNYGCRLGYFELFLTMFILFCGVFSVLFEKRTYGKGGAKTKLLLEGVITMSMLIVYVVMFVGMKENSFSVDGGVLRIGKPYSYEIKTSSLDTVYISSEKLKFTIKTNGFGANGVAKGFFRSKQYGLCRVYIHDKDAPKIFIRTSDGKMIIINLYDAERTTKLYEKLLDK